jgi:AcrR family transcriptional regulator
MDTATAILEAAAALLEAQGVAGLTTRAVCEAAGVKAPTLYHHFGDKEGLQRALIQRGLAEFMQRKRMPPASADPLEQLRFGWDVALEFALKRPALHALFAQHALTEPALLADAYALLHARVQRLVDMGRFRGPADAAARAVFAASQGAMSLVHHGEPRKNVEAASELIFNAIVNELSRPGT